MMIQVCIGSSCHVHGSYEVKTIFEQLLRQHGLEQQTELRPAFCLGACGEGVSTARQWAASQRKTPQIFSDNMC